MPKKFLFWVCAAFLMFYVARHPAEAASTLNGLGSAIANGAQGISDAVAGLTPKSG